MYKKLKKYLFYEIGIDRFLLNHLTSIIFISFGVVWILQIILKQIELSYALTSTGAILAFWFGYKKYERDKEIQHIENYMNNIYLNNLKENFYKLELLYNLKEKNIINKDIWYFIEKNFWRDFESNFDEYIKILASKYISKKGDDFFNSVIDDFGDKYSQLLENENFKYKKYLIINLNKEIEKTKNNLYKSMINCIIILLKESI